MSGTTKAPTKKGGAAPPTPAATKKAPAAPAAAQKSAAPKKPQQAAPQAPQKAQPAKPAKATATAAAAAAAQSSTDGAENGAQTLSVPHRFKLDTKKKALVAYCDLPRVPQKYIVCEPTDDAFRVETPKWTRKYFLDAPYPDGIKVKGSAAEAEFDGKTLQVVLPITTFPDAAREKQAKVSEDIRKGKELRFKDEVGKGWKALQANAKAAKASEEEAKARAVSAVSGGTLTAGKGGAAPSAIVEAPEEKRTKKSKTFLQDDASQLKELMAAAGEAEADRVASKQMKMTLLQQMRMEAKQAKMEKKTRRREQQQESVSKVLSQRKRTLDETNPNPKDKKGGGQGGKPAKKARK